MSPVTINGLDIAKSVFQAHGISATGEVLTRRQVRRGQVLKFFASLPSCLIGIGACASARHGSRELQSLSHQVKLMPPANVKPYMKRQKNDMTDAEAICEAVIRYAQRHGTRRPWLVQLLARRPTKVAAVALANKVARMVWAFMAKGERYREPAVQVAESSLREFGDEVGKGVGTLMRDPAAPGSGPRASWNTRIWSRPLREGHYGQRS